MPLREFADAAGLRWRVWDTVPTTPIFGQQLPDGWLTFEAGHLRRRLLHVPAGWAAMPDGELQRLCLEARPEPPRKRLIE